MNRNQRENIDLAKNLPAGQMSQHLYPRLAINDPGPDGEITLRLILGLPCCGVDLDLECPPHMTIGELGVVVRAFFELRQTVAALPTFSVCNIKPAEPAEPFIEEDCWRTGNDRDHDPDHPEHRQMPLGGAVPSMG